MRARGTPHAAEGSARPADAAQAQGVRRTDASAPGAEAGDASVAGAIEGADCVSRKGLFVSKPLIQTTGRRKEAVARVRLRPGTGKILVNGVEFARVLPDPHAPGHRQGTAAAHADRRGLRRRRDARRRRGQWSGRRDPARHRPGPRHARPRYSRGVEEGWTPPARRSREGTPQVRPQEGAQGAAVLEAVAGRARAALRHRRCSRRRRHRTHRPVRVCTGSRDRAGGRRRFAAGRPGHARVGRPHRAGARGGSAECRRRGDASRGVADAGHRVSRGARRKVPAAIVSASHNPWSDNGVKVVGPDGRKLLGRGGDRDRGRPRGQCGCERGRGLHARAARRLRLPRRRRMGRALRATRGRRDRRTRDRRPCGRARLRERRNVRRRRAGAGAGGRARRRDMRGTHGRNINDECGSTHPESLQAAVLARSAAVGLAIDGDGDRVARGRRTRHADRR